MEHEDCTTLHSLKKVLGLIHNDTGQHTREVGIKHSIMDAEEVIAIYREHTSVARCNRPTNPPLVYIAGPYRAENAWLVERNIRRAEEMALAVATEGAMPVCPHTMTRFFGGTMTDDFWLQGDIGLMLRCDAVLMMQLWKQSTGSIGEHDVAEKYKMPIFKHRRSNIHGPLAQLRYWLDNH